jgi:two-component system, OmpR family, sensor histidine kinase BaeS
VLSLRWVRSIKLKFSIVIVLAIATAVVMSQVGYSLGWPLWLRPVLAAVVSLTFVQVFARGMTSPLRAMASAAKGISAGDFGARVTTPSVDEVGQLAVAFNSMAGHLEAADRQRRDLIANVSHELRTPIAGIRGALENLIDGVSVPTAEMLQAMHGRVERLQHLVDDLLDLSRLESGDVAFDRQPSVLADIVHGAVDEVRFDNPSVHISIDVPTDIVVLVDPERFHQVVANLLENALVHGAPPFAVQARLMTDQSILSVTDGGSGLPLDDREREELFQRFHRGRIDGLIRPGSGLGLSIVRWIVELHGGTISAQPNEPSGARFDVNLPMLPNTAQ